MTDYQYLIDSFNQFPLLIQIVWIISVLLFLSILVLIFFLKTLREQLRINEAKSSKLKKEYEELLVKYLYSGNEKDEISSEQQAIIDKLKLGIHHKLKRELIISTLNNLMNEISGEMAQSIKTLYYKTGLLVDSTEKLKSKNWYKLAKSIGELSQFQIKEIESDVVQFANHPKKEVRKEVQLYMVKLFRFEGLSFLNNLTAPLSEWDQVQLLEILQKHDDQQICDIIPWLKSNNSSVVLFALKLAKIYNQFEIKEPIIDLLSHKNEEIRIETINVLGHLHIYEAKAILKTKFNHLGKEEQIAFFELLENLLEPEDELFIEKHLFHENFEIKYKALSCLKSLNVEKFEHLNNLSLNEIDSTIFKFIAAQ